ncbi:hypothetical protein T492DRAFT_860810 [Pavlovales sp. CCMP2436]|nr:hypothetical protein T492DRAFT_860810 [Pavlovales sp. CCMP2436]
MSFVDRNRRNLAELGGLPRGDDTENALAKLVECLLPTMLNLVLRDLPEQTQVPIAVEHDTIDERAARSNFANAVTRWYNEFFPATAIAGSAEARAATNADSEVAELTFLLAGKLTAAVQLSARFAEHATPRLAAHLSLLRKDALCEFFSLSFLGRRVTPDRLSYAVTASADLLAALSRGSASISNSNPGGTGKGARALTQNPEELERDSARVARHTAAASARCA